MKIAIANDHRGFPLKEHIEAIVSELGHDQVDLGSVDDCPVDYPDMAYAATVAVTKKEVGIKGELKR